MRPIAVTDAETDPFRKGRIPRPFLWGYYDGSQYRQFTKTEEAAAFIAEQDAIVYAHNGGKFDIHYLLDYLEPYDELSIINGRIAKCNIGLAELRDSYCIINEPLEKYKKDKIDYSLFEKDQRYKRANWIKIERYLKSDCVYLWEMVTEFVRRFGPELTLAGAAMKQWKKLSDMPMDVTDSEFYEILRPYYYGGRVECFRSGVIETNFSVFDINSAYPFAMLHQHPYSANYERSTKLLKNADFVTVECIAKGCFPYRDEHGLTFPCDNETRVYNITMWEYRAALDTKTVLNPRIIESIRFIKHTDFSVYINKFWDERVKAKKRGDVLGALFAKLMMNSLYGKFAANPDNYNNYMIVPPSNIAMFQSDAIGKWKFGGEMGPWLLATAELQEWEKRFYNVATGASITGFVRAMLWRAIHSSKGVLYCDTDSIAAEKAGTVVRCGEKLGEWENEGNFDKAGIAGKKMYIFRGVKDQGERTYKTASKGVRLTHAQLWAVARGDTIAYKSETPTYSIAREPGFTNRNVVNTARINHV